MGNERRFLIGFGERLTEPVTVRRAPGDKLYPYGVEEARERLAPMAEEASAAAADLDEQLCPRDEVVTVITLHPAFLAKSYFPLGVLAAAEMTPLGSRPTNVRPEAVARRQTDQTGPVVQRLPTEEALPATELFVSCSRTALRGWAERLRSSADLTEREADLRHIESVRLPTVEERLRYAGSRSGEVVLEVVLHGAGMSGHSYVLEALRDYAAQLGMEADTERAVRVGKLGFLPVAGPAESVELLAQFSFLRTVRSMPRLREFSPIGDVLRSHTSVQLPEARVLDSDVRVAVFDGGLPAASPLAPWVTALDPPGIGPALPEYLEHGQHVSSALLFGPLNGLEAPVPFSRVDHYRVLDANSDGDPYELYDVIRRIENVLAQSDYEFINLSLGPDLPIEDDEVHVWTAFLDEWLSDGRCLASVAIGNNGQRDQLSGNARVQVPADCVNALSVGAANCNGLAWKRADYSAHGPGRSPGVVKPDVVAFGGCTDDEFFVVGEDGNSEGTAGTSFASPSALRTAVGVRAIFGSRLDPLMLKALLIHTAGNDDHPRTEVGWGRVVPDIDQIVSCPDSTARVLYQGQLSPAKYLRAQIPLPDEGLHGLVTITATLVFASPVDPDDPSNYTRSGVEIFFRPHAERFSTDEAVHAKTTQFFGRRSFASEAELRADAHKWETVLHEEKRMRASSLLRPTFDIHYNARESGHATTTAGRIRYAMIISISAPRTPNLYDRVLTTYASQLEALAPVLELPLRVEL